jgi:predicted esterase
MHIEILNRITNIILDIWRIDMIFKEFGNKNKPVIIFLHGSGLSWWSLKPQIEALRVQQAY